MNLGENLVISSIGLADDTVFAANLLTCLWNILYLGMIYCRKYGVTLCPTKTKLLRVSNVDKVDMETFNPIEIDGKEIQFSSVAEHVGILRSSYGNLPNLMNRISCHKKSLGATLSVGLARNHRASPLVGLRVEQMYATPVLLSGLASLVLSESELSLLDMHFKETTQNIQKLLAKTPRAVVYFLAGCLPLRAVLHLRQLTLFGMVARLDGDPLLIHARNILSRGKPSSKSWFWQIRDICLQYNLEHPLVILENPPSKEKFKKTIKSHVISYWENKLRSEASPLCLISHFTLHL